MQPRFFLLREVNILRMERYAVELTGEETGEPSGSRLGDELDVFDLEPGGLQHLAPHDPVKPADAAAGRAEALTF